MVSVEKALELIATNCVGLRTEKRLLANALNTILAKAILSPIDMPPFRQSAMDGYAIHFTKEAKTYTLIGEIAAGSAKKITLNAGEAVRIFTGAAVPDTATHVVQQELITRTEKTISFTTELTTAQNIRPVGEQIKEGETALHEKSLLNAAAIGFLASIGITTVEVYAQPKIGLLLTGDELIKPGTSLTYGQIYESNSIMLEAALKQHQLPGPTLLKVADDLHATQTALAELLSENDVVLISGGISVGDYDFVKTALENLGVTEQFYKVKQKPGKPLFFGTKGMKLVFALPGNPASALTCFYIYALPALQALSGKEFTGLKKVQRKISGIYQKKAGLAHFLKVSCNEESVTILESQSSAMLNTYALANGLLFVPEATEKIMQDERVDVYLLD